MLVVMDTKEAGRRGGLRRKERLSKERLTEIGRKAAQARWAKKRKPPRSK
jgi:hypothetical protein